MNAPNALMLSILRDCLFGLTAYLWVAQRRIDYNETPLNAQLVQDAQQMSQALRIKINLLQ